MRTRVLTGLALAGVFVASTLPAHAQGGRRRLLTPQGARGNLGGTQQPPPNRALLERQVRQTMARVTQRRVGLNDEQMRQLAPVNQKFEARRIDIMRQERQTRFALRDAMADSAHVDQARISQYLDQLAQLQRQRIELFESEQKDLSQFMTPLQRAKYLALQEQVRRRVEQLRPGMSADSIAADSLGPRRRPEP